MDTPSLFQASILGLVEGLTEFIPVSSTGHLIVVQDWLGLEGQKENAFAIFIQLGAILAVVWHFRRRLVDLVLHLCLPTRSATGAGSAPSTEPPETVSRRAGLRPGRESNGPSHQATGSPRPTPADRRQAGRLLLNLVLATIPAVAVGLPTEDWIEAHFFNPVCVAIALIAGGAAMLLIEHLCRRPAVETLDAIPVPRALGVGAAQVLAILFPGVSRSGATIMGGLAFGLSRRAATEFSFFLAIPAMLGASAIKLYGARDLLSAADVPAFGVGFGVAFVSALLVVRGLLAFVARYRFTAFALYRVAAGAALLLLR